MPNPEQFENFRYFNRLEHFRIGDRVRRTIGIDNKSSILGTVMGIGTDIRQFEGKPFVLVTWDESWDAKSNMEPSAYLLNDGIVDIDHVPLREGAIVRTSTLGLGMCRILKLDSYCKDDAGNVHTGAVRLLDLQTGKVEDVPGNPPNNALRVVKPIPAQGDPVRLPCGNTGTVSSVGYNDNSYTVLCEDNKERTAFYPNIELLIEDPKPRGEE